MTTGLFRLGRRSLLLAFACAACTRKGAPADPGAARLVTVGSAVTETVYALGRGDAVVAVDTSSLHPEVATRLPQVGYQRSLAAEGILALRPTLVLASSDAGPPAVLEHLRASGVRVEVLDGDPSVAAARARMARIAELVSADATELLARFDREVAEVSRAGAARATRPRVLAVYARGAGNVFAFGRLTPVATMIDLAGGRNAMDAFEGSRPLTAESVVAAAPDVVLVPSRGLASLGGEEGLFALPGLAETPAGRARRVVAIDDLLLLGLGPRTGEAGRELVAAFDGKAVR